jgi:circadian clock protein KaiC
MVMDERVKTYVDGLDDILGGGVPGGHLVLVSGLPGTMKSSFTYSILYNNARYGNVSALYLTLEQTKASLEKQMAGMGFRGEIGGRLPIVDVAQLRKDVGGKGKMTDWVEFLKRTLERRREMQPYDLFVFDSLEALEVLAKFQDPRAQMFEFFDWLRAQGGTSFVLAEAPPEGGLFPTENTHRLDANYLADGVIHLKMHQVSDVAIQRRLRIVKMRGTAHETGYYALVFEEGKFSVTRALSV